MFNNITYQLLYYFIKTVQAKHCQCNLVDFNSPWVPGTNHGVERSEHIQTIEDEKMV